VGRLPNLRLNGTPRWRTTIFHGIESLPVAFGPTPGHSTPPAWLPDAPVPLLFGGPELPYLRFDGFLTGPLPGDSEAAEAMDALSQVLAKAEQDALLAPGEALFVDNYRAVHGRRPFAARYDGTDRWLKRISVTRDLRRSRDARAGAASRVVG
jgi:L-asparagine oxygenase